VSSRAGYVYPQPIESRWKTRIEMAAAIPAREDTGPPGEPHLESPSKHQPLIPTLNQTPFQNGSLTISPFIIPTTLPIVDTHLFAEGR